MDAVKLSHKDGRERVATTPAELVAAKFDGFAERSPQQRAAATRKAAKADGAKPKRTPRKRAAGSPTESAKGAPPADSPTATGNTPAVTARG